MLREELSAHGCHAKELDCILCEGEQQKDLKQRMISADLNFRELILEPEWRIILKKDKTGNRSLSERRWGPNHGHHGWYRERRTQQRNI